MHSVEQGDAMTKVDLMKTPTVRLAEMYHDEAENRKQIFFELVRRARYELPTLIHTLQTAFEYILSKTKDEEIFKEALEIRKLLTELDAHIERYWEYPEEYEVGFL